MMLFLPDWFLDNFTFLSLIAVFVSFYYYSTSTYGKWQKLNIPYLPPVPLFGNTFRMMLNLEHPIDTFERFYYSFPDAKVFGFYQMREPMLLVRDPELINRILVNDFSYFTDHGMDMDPSSTVVELVLNPTSEDKFTDADIMGNAILLFAAGSATVSSSLTFCLYELALNKEIQDKVRAEILSMKAKHDGQLNNDYLMDLRYTTMVLEETGRKYSIALSIIRVATKSYTSPDKLFAIEKGQKIVIPIFSIHRDPKYYPDPLRFDPKRFSTEQKSQRPNGTYIPFGDGPRICIGKRFAESEMKLVLSNLLSKFEVLPCEQTEIPIDIRSGPGLITPKNSLVLKFRPIIEH